MKSEKKGLRLYTIHGGILGRTVNGVIRTVLGKLLGLLWTSRRRQPQADDQTANIMASRDRNAAAAGIICVHEACHHLAKYSGG